MDRARELLDAVGQARAIALHQVAVDGVDAPGLDRRQADEPIPLVASDRPRARAMASEDDHFGRVRHRRLDAVPRIVVALVGRDGVAPGEADPPGYDGLAGRDGG